MARFEELQELWQSQPAQPPVGFDLRGLTEELRRFGRRQNWINGIKVAVLAYALVRLTMPSRGAPWAVCGTLLMSAGLATYLVLDWRNQIGLSRLDFSSPSVEFIRQAQERLQHQLNPMRRVFWLLVVSVGGGFNLILLARHGATLAQRIEEHLFATALPFAAYRSEERRVGKTVYD